MHFDFLNRVRAPKWFRRSPAVLDLDEVLRAQPVYFVKLISPAVENIEPAQTLGITGAFSHRRSLCGGSDKRFTERALAHFTVVVR